MAYGFFMLREVTKAIEDGFCVLDERVENVWEPAGSSEEVVFLSNPANIPTDGCTRRTLSIMVQS